MNDRDLAMSHGVAVYQVGEVYKAAPPATLKKWFVAVNADKFLAYDVQSIPLANSEADAWTNAVTYLKLRPGSPVEPQQLELL